MSAARNAAANFFSGPPPMAPQKRPDVDFWGQAKAKALSAPPPPQRPRAGAVQTAPGAPRSGGQALPPRSTGLDPRRRPLTTEDVHNALLGLNRTEPVKSISQFLRIQAAQGRLFGGPRAPALNVGTREQWLAFVNAAHVAGERLGENPKDVDAALKIHDPRYRAAYQTPEFR